jgi:hypothetical protein
MGCNLQQAIIISLSSGKAPEGFFRMGRLRVCVQEVIK